MSQYLVSKHDMFIGYARVSTNEQNTRLQLDALKHAGCAHIFSDEGVSGTMTARPALNKALQFLKAGDVLIVWKLDRLGRSLSHLINLTAELGMRSVAFKSLSESIDTTTAQGRLVFHMMGALAEFERSLIAERTSAGLAAAKTRGVHIGRKRKLTPEKVKHARKLIDTGERPDAVAKTIGVSRATLCRYVRTNSETPQLTGEEHQAKCR
jgi:DNA invertase Pin-like site-specific DNA recombinase